MKYLSVSQTAKNGMYQNELSGTIALKGKLKMHLLKERHGKSLKMPLNLNVKTPQKKPLKPYLKFYRMKRKTTVKVVFITKYK